ncbi:MAG: phage tail tape measure C-terminal domain-containing protein [Pseudomonadota bacterium]
MTNNNFSDELTGASQSLNEFVNGPAKEAGETLAKIFEVSGRQISHALSQAAKSGEISFKNLAQSIIRDLSNLAFDKYVTKPLDGLIDGIIKSLPMPSFGARASGGQINVGGAYLVGENGPEMFVPREAGRIENEWGGAPINIHINMPSGASLTDVKKSSNQVAAALARAVERGRGLL